MANTYVETVAETRGAAEGLVLVEHDRALAVVTLNDPEKLNPRLGYQRTFELFAGGRHLSGAEAAELGLANALVPHDELLAAARAWCDRLESLPAHVATMMKPLLRHAADLTWEQAIAMEEFAEPQCFTTAAHRDAVRALLA
jgi:2-(1,2-epoxy-1,2-dihydrophenyl)acetyl-CoA isomerase